LVGTVLWTLAGNLLWPPSDILLWALVDSNLALQSREFLH